MRSIVPCPLGHKLVADPAAANELPEPPSLFDRHRGYEPCRAHLNAASFSASSAAVLAAKWRNCRFRRIFWVEIYLNKHSMLASQCVQGVYITMALLHEY